MKILVLGGSGMAGHTISTYFNEQGHDVTTFDRRPLSTLKSIIGDVTDFDELRRIIDNGNFTAVINAIGILNEAAEENKADAVLLNSYLPHFMSKITQDKKTRVIQLSTDCVFSGRTGSYSEDSLRDGESFYDRSKALGELVNEKDLTFRNSIVGPDMNKHGIGLFNWFMSQKDEISGYSHAMWTGVTTLTLAKAIDCALHENLSGLYHLVNNEPISKYDLLCLFNAVFKNNQIGITPNDNVVVDKSLINTRTDFTFRIPPYKIMIEEMKEWIVKHKYLYHHYDLKEVL